MRWTRPRIRKPSSRSRWGCARSARRRRGPGPRAGRARGTAVTFEVRMCFPVTGSHCHKRGPPARRSTRGIIRADTVVVRDSSSGPPGPATSCRRHSDERHRGTRGPPDGEAETLPPRRRSSLRASPGHQLLGRVQPGARGARPLKNLARVSVVNRMIIEAVSPRSTSARGGSCR